MTARIIAAAALLVATGFASEARSQTLPTFSEVLNGHTELVTYRGVRAVKLVPAPETAGRDEDMMALLGGAEFTNGTIQIDVAGAPRPGMPADSRGFIGVSFRTGAHGAWSDVFYLRPTNGRADDQVRRNHSTQYSAYPDFSFAVARQQAPEKYESYVDLEPGVWTRYRITVEGTKARLYVHGATEPCLIVNDLKLGDSSGAVALWIGPGTEGYFTALEIKAAK